MHSIDTPNAQSGKFKDRDEFLRTPGTIVDASIMQAMQDEIINVIKAAGFELEKGNNTQLHAAVTKFVTDLGSAIDQDIELLNIKDSEFSRAIKNLQDAMASLGGPVTNYGTTTLMNEYTFTEPSFNDYYAAPHTKGYAQVYLNGQLLRRGKDWDSANNQMGVALKFKFTDINPGLESELLIVTFCSGDLIKVTSQLQIGMTTTWYGDEESIPYGYLPLKGQLVESIKVDYPKLYELFKNTVNFPDTRDATKKSVGIIKGLDVIDLGIDFSNRYYGPGDVHPSTNINGGIPIAGDCYYNTTYNKLFFYNGTSWLSMEQFFTGYSIHDDTRPNRNLDLSVAKIALKSNEQWKLPVNAVIPEGSVIEIYAFPSFTGDIIVGNATIENIDTGLGLVKNISIQGGTTKRLIYTGNRTWTEDNFANAMKQEVMAFVNSPVVEVTSGETKTASVSAREFMFTGSGKIIFPETGLHKVIIYTPYNLDYLNNQCLVEASGTDKIDFNGVTDPQADINMAGVTISFVKVGKFWKAIM